MKRKQSAFFKSQTVWIRRPAALEMHRGDTTIGLGIYPEHSPGKCPEQPSLIFFTPQEAMAVAAWISEAAEHLTAKAARKAARKAAKEQRA